MIDKNKKQLNLCIVIIVNLFIFVIVGLMFNYRYEQVDDFIIYNLYSGLDGTHGIYGIYIHPILCGVIGIFYKIAPIINWHSIFLLAMQFICFTIIGYLLLKKHQNELILFLYCIFASVFYSILLLQIQYTSVSALLILTAFFMMVYDPQTKKSNKYKIICILLYTIGILIRIQSLIIILPFFGIYWIHYLVNTIVKKQRKEEFKAYTKLCIVMAIITVFGYMSNYIIYQTNDTYREYQEYNKLRTELQDFVRLDYDENKEIFEEIGWSKKTYSLFRGFNFGDENVYSKEHLQKLVDYINENYHKEINIYDTIKNLVNNILRNWDFTILFIAIFVTAIYTNRKKNTFNFLIFFTTVALNLIFVVLNRVFIRVVLPEYIIGTLLLINNLELKQKESIKNNYIISFAIFWIVLVMGNNYNYGYSLQNYRNYREAIEYTNENKDNAYLFTIPSLQYRYLAYSVFEMPPKESFSNLRPMGGWDMFTENYYNFKNRYDLDGTFLDLTKDNVYLIDADVYWSGVNYKDYVKRIVVFIKEHYGIDVTYEKVKEFGNVYIYKLEVEE